MGSCSTCGGSGRIPLLGPNDTDCPDCTEKEEGGFNIYEFDMAVWFSRGNPTLQLQGVKTTRQLSFNPVGGVALWVKTSKWVATTVNGNISGDCTDVEALANQLQAHDKFEFQGRKSVRA